MHIVEFTAGTLRFLDKLPHKAPTSGFLWIYVERESLQGEMALLQQAAQTLGGSAVLDLHVKDLGNRAHPSHYDYTSVYDLVIFRRLASDAEVQVELGAAARPKDAPLSTFSHVRTRAVGFVVFDRLLITVHPQGCFAARSFIERYLKDALQVEGLSAAARSRLPVSAADLMLRMLNVMVDNYLEVRKVLSAEVDQWQQDLLAPNRHGGDA